MSGDLRTPGERSGPWRISLSTGIAAAGIVLTAGSGVLALGAKLGSMESEIRKLGETIETRDARLSRFAEYVLHRLDKVRPTNEDARYDPYSNPEF